MNLWGGGHVTEAVMKDLVGIVEPMNVPETEQATESIKSSVNVETNLGEPRRTRDLSTRIKKPSVRLMGYGK